MRAVLLIVAIAAALAVSPARADSVVELVAHVKPSVVAVGTHDPARQQVDDILGTGFAVGDGTHILTALHVVRAAGGAGLSVYVGQGDDATIYGVTQIVADEAHDMALLTVDGAKLPALHLFLGPKLDEGQEVAFIGFPIGAVYGLYPATHRGIVSAITPIARTQVKSGDLTPDMIRAIDDKVIAYQLDATSFPGNSGGPLVDPSDGSVVGIVDSTFVQSTKEHALDRPSGITFAMPIPPAVEMLKKAGLEP
ncbi:MAG: trypsin-like serine protease [Alphaproteobacteria bacterium]|nr:trypsin-like serine protease [Alphaproteobacteria bacterium]